MYRETLYTWLVLFLMFSLYMLPETGEQSEKGECKVGLIEKQLNHMTITSL
jgi:hypothetical protein